MKIFFTLLFSAITVFLQAQTPTFQMTIGGTSISSACVRTTVTFTNTSSIAGSSLKWDFGDGNTATTSDGNAVYAFTNAGTFTVKLINTASNLEASQTIKINKIPTASFNVSASTICVGNQVSFTSTSTGDSPIKYYYWSFGDGGSVSDVPNVLHPYNKSGTYNAYVYVEDQIGCKSTSSSSTAIRVTGASNVSFQANGNDFYSCNNTISFSNTSVETGAVTYTWDFGDGTNSTDRNPGSHTYSKPGAYTVKLSGNISGNTDCTPSFSHIVYVGRPTLELNVPSTICVNTAFNLSATVDPVEFKVSDKDIIWSSPDGGVISNDSTSIYFNNSGNYQVVATNTNGCPNPTTKNIVVNAAPSVSLSISPSYGICTATNVSLAATVANKESIDQIIWNTGDGILDSNTNYTFQHLYTIAGNYSANVRVKNKNGCVSSSSVNVPVSEKCIDDGLGSTYNDEFSFASASCTDKYLITFSGKDTLKTVSGWTIDGLYHAAHNDTLIIKLTPKASKLYNVVTNYTNGTIGESKTITIIDEKAKFSYINNNNSMLNCAQNTYSFYIDTSIALPNLVSLQWNITDLKTNQSVANAFVYSNSYSYLLPEASSYRVLLTIFDKRTPGCTDTMSTLINTQGPVVDFKSYGDSSFCYSNPSVAFQNNTIAFASDSIVKMDWSFGDGGYGSYESNFKDSIRHSYNYNGGSNYYPYTVTLAATDKVGCRGYLEKWYYIKIYNPQVSFSTPDSILCSSKKILIDNTSSAATPVVYTWTVGDTSKTYLNRSDLNLNVNVSTFPSSYDVRLHVKDAGGCEKDTLIKNYIKFIKPTAAFVLNNEEALHTCPPYTLQYNSKSTGIDSLYWILGDGSMSSDNAPLYTVLHPGNFDIKLMAVGYDGCADSVTQNYVSKGPVGTLHMSDSIGCTPFRTDLTVKSKSSIVSYQWDYGNGTYYTANNADSVRYSYVSAGNFAPSVTIVGEEGCTDKLTLADSIIVKSLSPSFLLLDSSVSCGRDSARFYNITPQNSFEIHKYIWNWNDGTTTETTSLDTIKHVFTEYKKNYNVTLSAITDFCSATSDSIPVSYHLIPVIKLQSLADSVCLNDTLKFVSSVSNVESSENVYQWSLDNRVINSKDSILNYYIVNAADSLGLKVTTEAGCSSDTSVALTLRPLPVFSATVRDNVICVGDTTLLSATGVDDFVWSDVTGTIGSGNSLDVYPSSTTRYFLKARSIEGCSAMDSLLVTVDKKVNLSFSDLYKFCTIDTSGIVLTVQADNASTYKWSSLPVDNSLSAFSGTNIHVYPKATTTYTVEAVSNNVCPSETGTILAEAREEPRIQFAASTITVNAGEVFTISPSVQNGYDDQKYHWTPETRLSNPYVLSPTAVGDKDITYTLHLTSDYGCSATDSISVKILCDGSKFYMANAFTPNNDGINDKFYVTGYGIKNVEHFLIFDRWGKKVFERNNIASNDLSQGWDGTVNGKLALPGTYMYVVELICPEGEKTTVKGSVLLIR